MLERRDGAGAGERQIDGKSPAVVGAVDPEHADVNPVALLAERDLNERALAVEMTVVRSIRKPPRHFDECSRTFQAGESHRQRHTARPLSDRTEASARRRAADEVYRRPRPPRP